MDNYYRIFLAIHIIAVISWMAGLLYLYRLFVYHAAETEQVVKDRFAVMENRLYLLITTPAMWIALLMGVLMVMSNPALLQMHWMHAKLTLVVFMIGMTHMSAPFRRKLQRGESKISSKTFRILNEIPTLLLIAIVFLVVS